MRVALIPPPAALPRAAVARPPSGARRLPAAAWLRIGATLMYVAVLAVGASRG